VFKRLCIATRRRARGREVLHRHESSVVPVVPVGDIGQILAVFEMLNGQVFLVTLVAGLVSLWRPGARAQAEVARPDKQRA
jgi:hypothetical protein